MMDDIRVEAGRLDPIGAGTIEGGVSVEERERGRIGIGERVRERAGGERGVREEGREGGTEGGAEACSCRDARGSA